MIYYTINVPELELDVCYGKLVDDNHDSYAQIGAKIYIDYNWSNVRDNCDPKSEDIVDTWVQIDEVLTYMTDGEAYGTLVCSVLSEPEQNYFSKICNIRNDNLNTLKAS